MKNRDIAPDFRKLIRKLPAASLEAMRQNLQQNKSHGKVIEAVILNLSAEMLRRKWGGKPEGKGGCKE